MFQKANAGVFDSGLTLILVVVCVGLTSTGRGDLVTTDHQKANIDLPYSVIATTAPVVLARHSLAYAKNNDGFIALSASTQVSATDARRSDQLAKRISMLIDTDYNGLNRMLEFSSDFTLGKADVLLADMDRNRSGLSAQAPAAKVARAIAIEQTFVDVTQSANAPAWFTLGSVHPERANSDRPEFYSTSETNQAGADTPSWAKADSNPNETIASIDRPVDESPAAISEGEALTSVATAIPEPSAITVMILLLTPALFVRHRWLV